MLQTIWKTVWPCPFGYSRSKHVLRLHAMDFKNIYFPGGENIGFNCVYLCATQEVLKQKNHYFHTPFHGKNALLLFASET